MIIYGSINSFDRSLEISSRDPWIAARGSKNTAFFSFFHFFFFLVFSSRRLATDFYPPARFSPLSYARIMRVIRVATERVE